MPRATAYLETSRHSVYYFRIRVPLAARTAIACTHIRRSLGTKSRREAIRRGARLLSEVEVLFDAAEKGEVVDIRKLSSRPLNDDLPSSDKFIVEATKPVHAPCLKLSDVWSRYRLEQQNEGVRKKTISDKDAQVALLIRIVGDIPIRNFGREEARSFKEIAMQLPPGYTHTEGKSIKQLVEKAQSTISVTTFNNYVKNLTTLFKFAIREGYCHHNPLEGLKVKQRVKASSLRQRFSDSDLRSVFDLALYPDRNQKYPYRFWLPYLGLLTGARLNELSQLYLDDFVTVQGVGCIHVREGRSDQRLKSFASERLIPLHEELKNLGLLDYVANLKVRGEVRLFPELHWSEHHGYAAQPSKWFNRYLNKLGVKYSAGRKDFHSFRHTVADQLKQQGISESLVGGLLGHTTSGITFGRYGKDWKPQKLVPLVEMLCLP
jgi:integrase